MSTSAEYQYISTYSFSVVVVTIKLHAATFLSFASVRLSLVLELLTSLPFCESQMSIESTPASVLSTWKENWTLYTPG
jgi:hypothetical protein